MISAPSGHDVNRAGIFVPRCFRRTSYRTRGGSPGHALVEIDRGQRATASGHHQAKASFFVISASLDRDFNIAAERAYEAEQPLEREAFEAPAQQIGDIGLANAQSAECCPPVRSRLRISARNSSIVLTTDLFGPGQIRAQVRRGCCASGKFG